MPKASLKSRGTEEEGVPHGSINKVEATQHRQRLEEVIFVAMENKIKYEDADPERSNHMVAKQQLQ